MKKTVILLMCLWSIGCSAQMSIKSDVIKDGKRIVTSNEFKCWHGVDGAGFWKDALATLSIVCENDVHLFFLNIELKSTNMFKNITIPHGGKLLIRLKDDSIMELSNSNSLNTTIGSYPISEEQLLNMGRGITKMRVETEKKYQDFNFKKTSEFVTLLSSAYDFLLEYITYGNQLGTRKDIHDNF